MYRSLQEPKTKTWWIVTGLCIVFTLGNLCYSLVLCHIWLVGGRHVILD